MKIAPGEAQLLIYDPSGANHARLHVRLKEEAKFAHVDVSVDLEASKRECARFPGPTLALVFLDRSSKQQIVNFPRHFQKGLNKPVEVMIVSAEPVGPTLRKEFLALGAGVAEAADDDEAFAATLKFLKDPTRFQAPRDPAPSAFRDAAANAGTPAPGPLDAAALRRTQPVALVPERPAWDEEESPRPGAWNPAVAPSSSSSHGIEGRSPAGNGRENAPPVFRGFVPPGENPSGPVAILRTPSGPVAVLRTPHRLPTGPAPRPKSEGKGALIAAILGVVGIGGGIAFGVWATSGGGAPTGAPASAETTPAMTPIVPAYPADPPPPGVAATYATPTPRPVANAGRSGDVWSTLDASAPTPPPATPRPAASTRKPPPAPGTVITVAQLRENVASWKNSTLTLEGVVTFSGGGYVPHRKQFNIQDATGGLVVDDPDLRGGEPPPAEGDRVRVTGALGDYRGMQQVRLTAPIVRLGRVAPPEPLRLQSTARFGEEIEGMLVRFDDVRLVSGRVPDLAANVNLRAALPNGEEVSIFLDLDTKIHGFELPPTFSFQGFLYQYAWTDVATEYVWIVYPRRREDFLF